MSCRSQSFNSTSQAFEHQSRIGGGDDPWPHLVSAKPTCPLSLDMACWAPKCSNPPFLDFEL